MLVPFRLEWSRRDRLREATRRHPIVLLQAPRLCAAELIAVGTTLGRVDPERRVKLRLADAPEILVVGNVRNERGESVGASAVALGFHTDRSFQLHPPEFTVLYALDVPRRGGDTEFSSLYRLYDECDASTRRAWGALQVAHVASSSYFDGQQDRETVHPLVRSHPDTGRRLVYSSPPYARRVLGLSESESETLLRRLADALEPPDYIHRWRPDDLLIWDNRAVVHRAVEADPGELRRLWRMSVYLDEATP